ncbi:MAG: hypothetical protein ISR39_08905 [Akkermansiaceae bacterium]|nr:hypothetical protein [Akkermansiaceae bacterium]
MKLKKTLPLVAALITPFIFADEKDHKHDKKGHHHHEELNAPNNGRILHEVEPHAEFFITKDRKVQITFIEKGEGANSVMAIGGTRAKPTKFTFEKTKKGAFISKEKLPEGMLVPIVLTFSGEKNYKARVRFNVNMEDCPTCDFLEYACTCDHVHVGEGHKHDHENEKK